MTKSRRQQYGLGSFVKKLTRPIKKVLKSPLGKAALLGGGLYGLNKWGPLAGKLGFSSLGSGAGNLWKSFRGLSGPKQAMIGLGALAFGTPLYQKLMKTGPYEEIEEETEGWDVQPSSIANIMGQAKDYYRNYDPYTSSLNYMSPKEFVNPSFYAAKGGRAGYYRGSQGPAGGASAGGDYGGNVNPQQEYAGRTFQDTYRGGDNITGGNTVTGDGTNVLQTPVVVDQPNLYEKFKGYFTRGPEEEVTEDEIVDPSTVSLGSGLAEQAKLAVASQKDQLRSALESSGVLDELKLNYNHGGIVGLANGGGVAEAQAEQMLKMEYQKYRNQGGTMSYQQFKMTVLKQAQGQGPMAQGQPRMAQPQMAAQGGRMGYKDPAGLVDYDLDKLRSNLPNLDEIEMDTPYVSKDYSWLWDLVKDRSQPPKKKEWIKKKKKWSPSAKAEGGLMDMGGMEKDYRQEGGFVPIGGKEKADDVPARLSKNEFVFTADAVRNAGGGDIDQGAQVMENVMKNLEEGGEISEESQGAQGMYNNMKQLETRVA